MHRIWMREDPEYPKRFAETLERTYRAREAEAVRRARESLWKPVLHNGKPVFARGKPLYEHVYSDRKLLQLLAKLDPATYGRR